MTRMLADSVSDVARAGQRIKSKVLVALVLSAVMPLLVLAFVVLVVVLPSLTPGETMKSGGLQLLLVFTLIGVVAGVWVIWDLGRIVARMGALMASENPMTGFERRQDDVGTLMSTFNRMRATIEQQAAEINTSAIRLDAAYKELESTAARLKETSFKDEVTGLYNRRFFSLRLEEELSRYRRFNHPVSVVLLDLDGFKAVNDEFAVLLVETSKAGARLYADRIREVVAKFPFSHGKVITASFGVASLPDDEAGTPPDLFRAADEALYTAKRAGKNQVAATPSPQRVP